MNWRERLQSHKLKRIFIFAFAMADVAFAICRAGTRPPCPAPWICVPTHSVYNWAISHVTHPTIFSEFHLFFSLFIRVTLYDCHMSMNADDTVSTCTRPP